MPETKPTEKPETKPTAAKKTDYVVMRGFWVEDDDGQLKKIEKGAIMALSAESAIDGVEAGALKKYKP